MFFWFCFLLGEGDVFFGFFPCFLVSLTTFGPDRLLAQTTFFFSNHFLPKPLRTILDPKKPWPMGLFFGTICCSCLGPPCEGPPLPKTTLCGIPRCVVWCVVLCCGVVCRCGVRSKFSWVHPKFGRSRLPSARQPLPTPPSAGPPKISPFFPSPAPALFLSLGLAPPGLHTTARELQTCTFERPGASNTKIPREEERMKIVAGE